MAIHNTGVTANFNKKSATLPIQKGNAYMSASPALLKTLTTVNAFSVCELRGNNGEKNLASIIKNNINIVSNATIVLNKLFLVK